jgi:hypothetical protein
MKNKIFLDMDGVLADFFGVLLKGTGKKKIKQLNEEDVFRFMTSVNDVEHFFASLPEFKSNTVLIHKILKFAGEYHICSAPLHDRRESKDSKRNQFFIRQSIYGKHAWVQQHLEPQPVTMCLSDEKWKDAPAVEKDGTPNILIDDRNENIESWEKAGGIGIKFQADEHFDDPNLDYIDKQLEKVKKRLKKTKSYNEAVDYYLKSVLKE